MIISIAGTSGSGKTTLVRGFLALTTNMELKFHTGNKSPFGLVVQYDLRHIFLPGQYRDDLQSCGCDCIKDTASIYKMVHDYASCGHDVIYEGLFVMDQTRGPELVWKHLGNFAVLKLTTPEAECARSIDERRAAQSKAPLANHGSTHSNYVRARNYAEKMGRAGAQVWPVSREEALDKLVSLLS